MSSSFKPSGLIALFPFRASQRLTLWVGPCLVSCSQRFLSVVDRHKPLLDTLSSIRFFSPVPPLHSRHHPGPQPRSQRWGLLHSRGSSPAWRKGYTLGAPPQRPARPIFQGCRSCVQSRWGWRGGERFDDNCWRISLPSPCSSTARTVSHLQFAPSIFVFAAKRVIAPFSLQCCDRCVCISIEPTIQFARLAPIESKLSVPKLIPSCQCIAILAPCTIQPNTAPHKICSTASVALFPHARLGHAF